ncbi:hypothetical protein F511_19169 [Dorcoceras hygrometricum]|uniref:Uncharacterized protein n=1 Tax=Dorcoceras hygrometricum TaxID=472368 RepID=A0A2Z7DGJ8_9LAMI|nr:hypothetical protein F511_19169 [Dorcoceras hygrometricum]
MADLPAAGDPIMMIPKRGFKDRNQRSLVVQQIHLLPRAGSSLWKLFLSTFGFQIWIGLDITLREAKVAVSSYPRKLTTASGHQKLFIHKEIKTEPGSDQFHRETDTSTVGGGRSPNPVHDWKQDSFQATAARWQSDGGRERRGGEGWAALGG